MPHELDRRAILAGLAAGLLPAAAAQAQTGLKFGPAQPFSFAALTEAARRLAREPYRAPAKPAPEIVEKIDYDAWGRIIFATDHALFAQGPQKFTARSEERRVGKEC